MNPEINFILDTIGKNFLVNAMGTSISSYKIITKISGQSTI